MAGKGWNANYSFDCSGTLGDSGTDGENGEDCGSIYIRDEIEVYAYGGAGGAGGNDESADSGAGAGGYPAAGIGGGRSRWWWRRPRMPCWRLYCWNWGIWK